MAILLTLISILIISIIVYFYNAFKYWKRKGVPYIEPYFPLGSISLSYASYAQKYLGSMYNKLKSSGAKYGGIYLSVSPVFMPIDPDIIKSMLMKNFDSFMDRGLYCNEDIDPLSAHLFSLSGKKWKNMRTKLSPTFTSGKIKMMFPTLIACSKDINTVLEKAAGQKEALDIRELTATFSTDVIANCAFGLECNSILNPDTEFRKYGRMFLDNSFSDKLKITLGFIKPKILEVLRIPFIKPEVTKYFTSIVKESISYREENKVHRKDFLDLLIRLKNNENINDDVFFSDNQVSSNNKSGIGDGFTAAEIAAQAFVFYVAGFETSSTTMTYCLMELAQNPGIQDKVREEINSIIKKHDGELTYDGIMEMTFLDQVINETLRIHPPLYMLNRICNKDYKIENTDITIEKGTKIIIPVLALHSDPEHYPNPEIFDPDRFSTEQTSKRHPCTYLPFGEGPRFCIGMRFGMLQTKIGVISLLRNYKYSIHEKTKLPVKYVSNFALLNLEEKVYFKIEKL